ncbi:MAG: PAS domain-containing protein [Acidobacteriia bacterium]|nr:PAS domain-containing protein [Terriglobia bacterium]
MIQRILRWGPWAATGWAALLIAIIAVCDWRIEFDATLGFLYMFPLVLLGTVLGWWQIILAALFCTFLSHWLDPFSFDMQVPRDILIFLTLATTGLLSRGVSKGYRRVEKEVVARRSAEEQLEFLIESSPAAVLTMTADGEILLANPAAHRLFAATAGSLPGRRITRYIPALGSVPSIDETDKIFRTEMQTRGQRESGEVFLADVFFSTYSTAAGPRLAALLVDASEHLREREEASLQQLLAGSRIMVAAVSHEVRNVCGAIGVMHENLARHGVLAGNKDFEALGSLVETLSKIASLELKQSARSAEPSRVDLREVLTDLRIVLEPYCEESEIELRLAVPDELPLVQADRHSLLQVLLNLTKNSQRAMEPVSRKLIDISVTTRPDGVSVRITDSGPGIPVGQKLFQPLQKGAETTGLGLYLSRAFMRSFRGDLRHDPAHPGCSFVLELAAAPEREEPASSETEDAAHKTLTA